jgi:hypothetical protein
MTLYLPEAGYEIHRGRELSNWTSKRVRALFFRSRRVLLLRKEDLPYGQGLILSFIETIKTVYDGISNLANTA